jgi:hypothetical protein
MRRRVLRIAAALAVGCSFRTQGSVTLEIRYRDQSPFLHSTAASNDVFALEHSTGFQDWTEIARVFDQFAEYVDAGRSGLVSGFYRVRSWPAQSEDDWSNALPVSTHRLFRPGSGTGLAAIAIVKWSLLLAQSDRVYFQDTVRYPFHLNYARARLPGYAEISAFVYGQQCLYPGPNQRMVVGSVMRAPAPWIREVGIEITGSAAFPAALAMDWVETVRRRLVLEPGWRLFYMPSDEQRAETEAHRAEFEARGIAIDSPNRWSNAVTP